MIVSMLYEVTIGIPVFRSVDYIKRTMESALSQSFHSIEFLVVDDKGDDGSISVVKELQTSHPRGKDIRIIEHDSNYGVGVSRNHILSEVRSRYLYFLDSDDMIEPDTIEKMVETIQKYNADIVYGSWERVDAIDGSKSHECIYPYQELFSPDSMALYAFKNYSTFRISVCNCLMDISFLRSSQLQFIDSFYWEDLAFTYEMVTRVNRAVLLPDITYHYLCRPGSLSHYQDRDYLYKDEILKNVETINYLKQKCQDHIQKEYLSYLCYNLEMNSIYIVCYILKYMHKIIPEFTYNEMRAMLDHPMGLICIIRFRNKLFQNFALWALSKMPLLVFAFSVRLFRKLKFKV